MCSARKGGVCLGAIFGGTKIRGTERYFVSAAFYKLLENQLWRLGEMNDNGITKEPMLDSFRIRDVRSSPYDLILCCDGTFTLRSQATPTAYGNTDIGGANLGCKLDMSFDECFKL